MVSKAGPGDSGNNFINKEMNMVIADFFLKSCLRVRPYTDGQGAQFLPSDN